MLSSHSQKAVLPVRGPRPSLLLRGLMGKLTQLALIAGPPSARQTATRGLNAVIVHNWQLC